MSKSGNPLVLGAILRSKAASGRHSTPSGNALTQLVASGTPTTGLDTGSDYALRLGAWGASSFFAGDVDELYV